MTRSWNLGRTLVLGLVAVLLTAALALIVLSLAKRPAALGEPVDALASSTDACVTCHRTESPGIVTKFAHSTMAAAEVTCRDCHGPPTTANQ